MTFPGERRFAMTQIMRDILIKAKPDKVFDLLAEPNNLPEIWPNVLEVRHIKKSKNNNGYDFDWTYKMAGVRLDGKCETIEFDQYKRIILRGIKGLDSAISWKFTPSGGKETRLVLDIDYEIPASVLGKLSEQLIVEENEHEIDAMLENVKSRVEFERAYA
jgi:uncharacterized membrane protein